MIGSLSLTFKASLCFFDAYFFVPKVTIALMSFSMALRLTDDSIDLELASFDDSSLIADKGPQLLELALSLLSSPSSSKER